MSQTEKALVSLLQHCNADDELAADKNINLIVSFKAASDIKSPIPNVSIHKFKNVPVVVPVPHRITKNIRDAQILMITKNPSTTYIEKLRECDGLLPKTAFEKEKELKDKVVYTQSSWRKSENLKSNLKNRGPKLRTAQQGKKVIEHSEEIQANKSQFVANSDSSELFSKIISVKQFKAICRTKEFANLLKTHQYIIADHRVIPDITKDFPKKSRKQPFVIRLASPATVKNSENRKTFLKTHNSLSKLEKADLDTVDIKYVYSQIKSVTRNTAAVLPLIVTTINKYDQEARNSSVVDLNFIVGKVNEHSVSEIRENIDAVVKYVELKLLKTGSVINGLNIKTDNSQSLPIM